jgi:hypothetical protein
VLAAIGIASGKLHHIMKKTLITTALLAIAVAAPAQTPVPGATISRPKLKTKTSASQTADAVSLNPQPLPPKDAGKASRVVRPGGDEVSLNPQPLPPKEGAFKRGRPGRDVALNPQPLPPKEIRLASGQRARVVGKTLMISGASGEIKAAAGNYQTQDGRVIVVNASGEISSQ